MTFALRSKRFLSASLAWLMPLVIMVMMFLLAQHVIAAPIDPTQDLLTSAETDVQTNFGSGSSFMWIVYVIEIIVGVGAYIKTKNIFSLVGIVIVLIFTTVAFTII